MNTTPGFNIRLTIRIKTNKSGRKIAQRWSPRALRWVPMPLADAELFLATNQADAA